ncbi:MAG: guanylate kinase [Candidatus Omnitrophota bacterium]
MSNSKKRGRVFVISAPSGCGKTTLCNRLRKSVRQLLRSVSYTTRPPRKGEQSGVDYNFVSAKQFKTLLKGGKFVESARVFGRLYGTPVGQIKQAIAGQKDILLSIDVKGAMQIKRLFGERSALIFILPPSVSALKTRLMKRHADSKNEIEKRLRIAKKEMSYLNKYDYAVVNNKLSEAVAQLKAIITTERLKTGKDHVNSY